MRITASVSALATCVLFGLLCAACDATTTHVIVDNRYPPSATPFVVYRAFWQAVAFTGPIAPGASSDRKDTLAASDNAAYVLVAPGWDPARSAAPDVETLLVLVADPGFHVHLDQTLHISVDDAHFAGNCAAGHPLAQEQADFVTQRVFADVFAGRRYDAATCSATSAQ